MSILKVLTPEIWTFDQLIGIDLQLVNNLSALATPKKSGHLTTFFGVRNLFYHISLSFFDIEAISSAISSEDSLM